MKIFFKKLMRCLPDKLYIQMQYFYHFHRFANLKTPQLFNEKLQWLKLYDRNPLYTTLVDKYAVKKWVASKIGEQYIIPTLGVWEKAEDIDFDKLPSQFVLKVNHDSGGIVICEDKSKLNKKAAIAKLSKALKNNGYWYGREWPYKNVKPRIIAEKYMIDDKVHELRDYKFFCFNGIPKILFVASDRQNPKEETKFDFYDMEFNHLSFTNGPPNASKCPQKPLTFESMKQLASHLSKNMPHIRVDFYEINGKIYFGEMTLYHWSGFQPFKPKSWDKKIGDWLKLPNK